MHVLISAFWAGKLDAGSSEHIDTFVCFFPSAMDLVLLPSKFSEICATILVSCHNGKNGLKSNWQGNLGWNIIKSVYQKYI